MQKHAVALMGAGSLMAILMGMATVTTQDSPPRLDGIELSELADNPPHRVINPKSSQELAQLLADNGYDWPPRSIDTVPLLVLESLPQDFPEIQDVKLRKTLFMRSLLPIVLLENRRLLEQREIVKLMFSRGVAELSSKHYQWLVHVARELRVKGDLTDPAVQTRLLRRLDEIPLNLALAQAAIESGWGTSRFVLEGNSLFGQWTFKASKGLVPDAREPDATHLVRAFPNLQASVRAYMTNLNTGKAYREFRETRYRMREQGQQLSPSILAGHLGRYSQRGMDYVEDLQHMINGRTLAALNLELPAADVGKLATSNHQGLPDS